MPPNIAEDYAFQGSLKFKYPKNRSSPWANGDTWLDGKRSNDGAEGFWRVHDNLYDVTSFIDKHPGGRMWLELTKGTDITEAFECHHITTNPEETLKKYLVRAAKTPRNSPFTFEEKGFFRTLKRRLIPIIQTIPKNANWISNMTTDLLFLGTFVSAVIATTFWSYALGFISGILLCFTVIAAHNYFHRKDNFRMYFFDLSLMNFREWRITHALSHHLFPNTIIDFEITFVEPLIYYLPHKKSWLMKYGAWLAVVLLWSTLFLVTFIKRILQVVYLKQTKQLHWSNPIAIALPIVMYLTSGQSLLAALGMWLYIITCGSSLLSFIAFTAGHHHPDSFHDGDMPRSYDKYDWGEFQLDTMIDRSHVRSSTFLTLTAFGDHVLHHLFPTLDHGALKYLYPEFEKVMNEFGLDLMIESEIETIKGQFKQSAKDKPNPKPPRRR